MTSSVRPIHASFVVSDFPPRIGGIATLNRDLAHALSADPGIASVLVLAFLSRAATVERLNPKLTVFRLARGNLLLMFGTLLRVLWRDRDEADLYHSSNVFPIGFFTLCIGKYLLRKPVIITFHGTDVLGNEGRLATRFAKRFTLRHADALVTVSASTRALAAKRHRIAELRIRVIPYALPPHERTGPVAPIRAAYGYTPDDIIVLTTCALVKRKGVEDLIRAVMRIPDVRVKLLVVGDGPERAALEALTEELNATGRVRFAGRVDDADSFYHHADVFSLASYYRKEEGDIEGLGIVMLEAAQHGLPVIGTNSGGIPETFIPDKTGFLVAERDVDALASAMERLAGDAALRMRMGQAGQRFVAERFDAARIAYAYVETYARLLS